MDAIAIPGAVCPSHPGETITFTCGRCGGFACERCRAISGGTLCAACVFRAGAAPLSAEPLLSEGFGLPFKLASQLLPFALIEFAIGTGIGLYNALVVVPLTDPMKHTHLAPGQILGVYRHMLGPFAAVMLAGLVVKAFYEACCIHLYADGIQGRRRSFGELWFAGANGFATTLICNVIRAFATAVGMVFCCLPAIPAYVLLGFAQTAALLDGKGPIHGLKASWALARKRFWLALTLELVALLAMGGISMVAGVAAPALRLLGTPGILVGALLFGLAGAVATLPLFAVNVALVIRARAADLAAGIASA
jgi:hypothetical protein